MDLSFPDIYGADRGFLTRSDVFSRTADGVSIIDIYNEFMEVLRAQNETREPITGLFTFRTLDAFAQLPTNPELIDEFEDVSEFGVPQSIRQSIDYTRMGIPLEWKDIATRFTKAFLRDAPSEQVELQLQKVLESDNWRIYKKTMHAITDKVESANRNTNEDGVMVYDLWDGSSGEVPPPFSGQSFTSSHNHYLVSGAATIDSGDLEQLIETVREHGYGLKERGETVVVLAHPTQANAIRTWRAGQSNANGAVATDDFIPAVNAPAFLSAENIVGDRPPATFNGLPIEGAYRDALIVASHKVPVGYVIAVATAGANSPRNVLAERQHPKAEHRGLTIVQTTNHPLLESYFTRGIGYGVRNRSAAAVLQVKASGSYENPTWKR